MRLHKQETVHRRRAVEKVHTTPGRRPLGCHRWGKLPGTSPPTFRTMAGVAPRFDVPAGELTITAIVHWFAVPCAAGYRAEAFRLVENRCREVEQRSDDREREMLGKKWTSEFSGTSVLPDFGAAKAM